eukprot:5643191-Amphidinium_carterae.1
MQYVVLSAYVLLPSGRGQCGAWQIIIVGCDSIGPCEDCMIARSKCRGSSLQQQSGHWTGHQGGGHPGSRSGKGSKPNTGETNRTPAFQIRDWFIPDINSLIGNNRTPQDNASQYPHHQPSFIRDLRDPLVFAQQFALVISIARQMVADLDNIPAAMEIQCLALSRNLAEVVN